MQYRVLFISLVLLVSFQIVPEAGDNSLYPGQTYERHLEVSDSIALTMVCDADSLPLYYYQHVFTGVCEDHLCKPVDIFLYWDASGSFLGFRTPTDMPLTKKDHVEFTGADYYLLYTILNNPHSILSKLRYDELTTMPTAKANQVDGISGATSIVDESSVVPGAIYTCYSLWHLVYNCEVVGAIQKQSKQSFAGKDDGMVIPKNLNAESANAGRLALTLLVFDENRQLKKLSVQKALTESLNQLAPVKALVVNNYISRQVFVFPETENRLANCTVTQKAFLWMIGQKDNH